MFLTSPGAEMNAPSGQFVGRVRSPFSLWSFYHGLLSQAPQPSLHHFLSLCSASWLSQRMGRLDLSHQPQQLALRPPVRWVPTEQPSEGGPRAENGQLDKLQQWSHTEERQTLSGFLAVWSQASHRTSLSLGFHRGKCKSQCMLAFGVVLVIAWVLITR